MKVLKQKRGIMTSYGDFFKGVIAGVIVGAILTYLITKGNISLPW